MKYILVNKTISIKLNLIILCIFIFLTGCESETLFENSADKIQIYKLLHKMADSEGRAKEQIATELVSLFPAYDNYRYELSPNYRGYKLGSFTEIIGEPDIVFKHANIPEEDLIKISKSTGQSIKHISGYKTYQYKIQCDHMEFNGAVEVEGNYCLYLSLLTMDGYVLRLGKTAEPEKIQI